MTTFSSRSPGLWATVLPLISGIATYGLSAWIATGTGDACGGQYLPGTGISMGVPLVLVILGPPVAVAYRARVAGKSWPVQFGLMAGAALLTLVAVAFASLLWAGGHNCFG